MTRLPTLTAKKLIRILRKLNFQSVRQEGSHTFFRHADGRTTVVPMHTGKDIGRGLLRSILRDIGYTPEQFQKLL